MNRVLGFFLGFLYLTSVTWVSGQSSSDGVEFQLIPIDISQGCTANILKATQRFKGTAFVLPKVLLGVSPSEEPLFEFMRVDEGQYVIQLGLRFINSEQEYTSSRGKVAFCNFTTIKEYLNRTSGPSDQIANIAPLPIKKISIRIPGVAQPAILGSPNTEILDYGGDQVAQFQLTETEAQALLPKLRGLIGVPIYFDLIFGARRSLGYIQANVKSEKISKELENSIAVQMPLGGALTSAQLSQLMAEVLEKYSADIYIEGGEDKDIASIASEFTKQIFNTAGVQAARGAPEDPNEKKDPGVAPTPEQPKPAPPLLNEPQAAPRLPIPTVTVNNVLKYFEGKSEINLKLQKMSSTEDHVYTTSTVIRSSETNTKDKPFHLASGMQFLDHTKNHELGETVFPHEIRKGMKVDIFPFSREIQYLKPVRKTHYYSRAELLGGETGLINHFPSTVRRFMMNPKLLVEEGNQSYAYASSDWFNYDFYIWGVNTEAIGYQSASVDRLDLEDITEGKDVIRVFFSNTGARGFSLKDFASENKYWKGSFDEVGGRYRFEVKEQDLGIMHLANIEVFERGPLKRKVVFQEKWNAWCTDEKECTEETTNPDVIDVPKQRSVISLRISVDRVDVGNLRMLPSTSRDGVVEVPLGPPAPDTTPKVLK